MAVRLVVELDVAEQQAGVGEQFGLDAVQVAGLAEPQWCPGQMVGVRAELEHLPQDVAGGGSGV